MIHRPAGVVDFVIREILGTALKIPLFQNPRKK